jgi:pimeloyl-ACP methyl ester carboxylesterase
MDTLSRHLILKMDSIRTSGDHAAFAKGFAAVWCIGPYRQPSEVDVHVRNYIYTTTLNNHTPDNGFPVYDTNYAARRIKDIACPVLIIRGDRDIPFIRQVTDYYQQQLPKATLINFTNVAHMLNMEKPEEFNRLVHRWLSGDKKGRINGT